MTAPRRTPLYDVHRRLGARMVEFAGFSMPVQYTSILEEHAAVRERGGPLRRLAHGPDPAARARRAVAAAERLLTRPVASLRSGRVRYGLLCNEEGGVVDDVTVYRLADDALFLCVNAANIEKDYRWIVRHAAAGGGRAQHAATRPACWRSRDPPSAEVLAARLEPRGRGAAALPLRPARGRRLRRPGLAHRLHGLRRLRDLPARPMTASASSRRCSRRAPSAGLVPAGLGARDTLRLEAALPLYGHELDETTSPLEAGLERFVKLEAGGFIGAEAIARRRDAGHVRAAWSASSSRAAASRGPATRRRATARASAG